MKSIKDIERMTLEDLDAVSLDEGITVPEGLSDKVRSTIGNSERKKNVFRIAGIAAAGVATAGVAAAVVAVIAGLSLPKSGSEPMDTFDDPYLAYAEVEKALAMVTEGMRKGIDMVEESEYVIERTTEILK